LNAVQQQRALGRRARQVVVERPRAAANDRLLPASGRERERKARRDVVVVVDRRLTVVPKPEGQRELWLHADLVLSEHAGLIHAVRDVRIALVDSKRQRRAVDECLEAAELERAAEIGRVGGGDLLRANPGAEQQRVPGASVISGDVLDVDGALVVDDERWRRSRRERVVDDDARRGGWSPGPIVLTREAED